MADVPSFEDLKETLSPEVGEHHQECMDQYYDQLEKQLPDKTWRALLREFDSYWMSKAEALADAAFVHGFLVGRRMGQYLTRGSGSGEADEAEE
jgi:hypothetical protein